MNKYKLVSSFELEKIMLMLFIILFGVVTKFFLFLFFMFKQGFSLIYMEFSRLISPHKSGKMGLDFWYQNYSMFEKRGMMLWIMSGTFKEALCKFYPRKNTQELLMFCHDFIYYMHVLWLLA